MNKILTNKSGNVILELRQDTMSAWLTLKQTGKLIDEQDILQLIEEAGIKTGYAEALEYVREHSLEKEFDVPFPIAICNKTESSSTLHYRFNPDLQLEPGSALDHRWLESLVFVNAGEPVAEYSSNVFEQGGSIYDIFGELIHPGNVDMEQAESLAGENIGFDAQNLDYRAQKSGYPYLDIQGRICLLDVLVLQAEDIPGAKKLILPVDSVVMGNLAYADLCCDSTLRIQGDLHSCTLFCRKDLFVEGEIVSCQGSGIHVLGDVHCRRIANSRLLCKGDLRFAGCIENSTLACEGEIIGDADNSIISGGLAQSGASISIAAAGSPEGIKTEIEIAISPYQRSLLMQMTKELVLLKEDPEGNAVAIHDLQFRIQKCESELDDQLNLFLKRPPEDRKSIKVAGESRPPVLYRVLKQSYYQKNQEQNLELIEKHE